MRNNKYSKILKLANDFKKLAQSQTAPFDLGQIIGLGAQIAGQVLQQKAPQYPPSQYPPSQYPPSQYPPSQYPPAQYPHRDPPAWNPEVEATAGKRISDTIVKIYVFFRDYVNGGDPDKQDIIKVQKYCEEFVDILRDTNNTDNIGLGNPYPTLNLATRIIAFKDKLNAEIGIQNIGYLIGLLDQLAKDVELVSKLSPIYFDDPGHPPRNQADVIYQQIIAALPPSRVGFYAPKIVRIISLIEGLKDPYSNPGLSAQVSAEVEDLKRNLQREAGGKENLSRVIKMLSDFVSLPVGQ